jgi:hypothetical protein
MNDTRERETTMKTIDQITLSRLARERNEFRGMRDEAEAKARAALARGHREGWEFYAAEAYRLGGRLERLTERHDEVWHRVNG